MEHRRLLGGPGAHRPFAGTDVFARVGPAAIDALIEALYERIERDPALRPLFGRDLRRERAAQKRFFTEWLGGEAAYTEHAQLPLKHRHDLLPITQALAERWLTHFGEALAAAVPREPLRREIYERTRALASMLVNEGDAPSALRRRHHGTCLRYAPAVESLTLARRGDEAALRTLLATAPDVLASVPHAATLLHLAVRAGRRGVVELLLDSGVDVDKPSAIAPLVFVTPLCAARSRRKPAVEALLLERGAREDVFTHAFVGDRARLHTELGRDASLAQFVDPAVDALEITPVHHAVAGDQLEALRSLLRVVPGGAIRGGARAVRDAVAHENVAMVRLLLEHGAPASSIGAGRWVLHAELAPMLTRAGASVDRSGGWIDLACTGNQGRRDDPEYVAALLRHGALVTDRRLTGQENDGGRATALHYAVKAGFTRTVALLLQHGADPTALDDNGLTPLDWLLRASKSVDRDAMRALLRGGRRH